MLGTSPTAFALARTASSGFTRPNICPICHHAIIHRSLNSFGTGFERDIGGVVAEAHFKRQVGIALAVLVAIGTTSCAENQSEGGSDSGVTAELSTSSSPSTTETTPTDEQYERECAEAASEAPEAVAVAGVPSDWDITSFDGTTIRAHWFPLPEASADNQAPTILMGPGWSMPGDTNTEAVGLFGALDIATLRKGGFNVLTWDPRGFGESGGTVMVNDKEFEGRDVRTLIDWIAAQPEAELDKAGDPRSGMVGGSYGGGIQLVVAAIDCRVDALVPVVAWHSLETSLYKSETSKIGWGRLLYQVTMGRSVDPHIKSAIEQADEFGSVDEDVANWFRSRGPSELVGDITAPTLLVHGTIDGLFSLEEAVTNYRILRDNNVPVSMVWFCGGHGTCLTDPGDPQRVSEAVMKWLTRWVHGDDETDTGPRVEILDQNGKRYGADAYPLPASDPIIANGSGTLELTATGGSGPAVAPEDSAADFLRSMTLSITPGPAENAVDVEIDAPDETALVVGAPTLEISYSGTSPETGRPTRVFAQLVDDSTGLVIGNQVTPIPLVLDGNRYTLSIPMEIVSFAAAPNSSMTLQLVATTVAYVEPQLGGSVTFDQIEVTLPTVTTGA